MLKKAFIGLLFLAGLEIFKLTMSVQTFNFMQSNLAFNDKSTRAE